MKRSFPGQWVNDYLGIAISDVVTNISASRSNVIITPGGSILTAPTLSGPVQNQKWKLISVSIQAFMGFTPLATGGVSVASIVTSPFGRLGKVKGYLIPGGSSAQGLQVTDSTGAVTKPPIYDETLAAVLWDETNELPPYQLLQYPNVSNLNPPQVNPAGLLPVGLTIQPSNPIDLVPGEPPLIGLQMTPSNIGFTQACPSGYRMNSGLFVAQAQYIINIDDGL
jgi:hypothetical protein